MQVMTSGTDANKDDTITSETDANKGQQKRDKTDKRHLGAAMEHTIAQTDIAPSTATVW